MTNITMYCIGTLRMAGVLDPVILRSVSGIQKRNPLWASSGHHWALAVIADHLRLPSSFTHSNKQKVSTGESQMPL